MLHSDVTDYMHQHTTGKEIYFVEGNQNSKAAAVDFKASVTKATKQAVGQVYRWGVNLSTKKEKLHPFISFINVSVLDAF